MVVKIIINRVNQNIVNQNIEESLNINELLDVSEYYTKNKVIFNDLYTIFMKIINYILYYKLYISLFIIIILIILNYIELFSGT